MQFCKSRSIAKRLFCLSPPSERSRGGPGLSPQGPGGSSQGWRLSWVLRRPGASASAPRPSVGAGCQSRAQGRTHSRLLAARKAWVGSGQNTESLFQIVKCPWETQSNQSWIQKSFLLIINNCKPGSWSKVGPTAINKNKHQHLGPKSKPMGEPQPCLQRPFGSRNPPCWRRVLPDST